MTKAELLAAIADASDEALIYIDTGDGILRSHVGVLYEPESEWIGGGSIVFDWTDPEEAA